MCIRSYSATFQLAEVRDAAGNANVSITGSDLHVPVDDETGNHEVVRLRVRHCLTPQIPMSE
jgi:hypothetical protein